MCSGSLMFSDVCSPHQCPQVPCLWRSLTGQGPRCPWREGERVDWAVQGECPLGEWLMDTAHRTRTIETEGKGIVCSVNT